MSEILVVMHRSAQTPICSAVFEAKEEKKRKEREKLAAIKASFATLLLA